MFVESSRVKCGVNMIFLNPMNSKIKGTLPFYGVQ